MRSVAFYSEFLAVAVMSLTFFGCGKEPITAWDSPRMVAAKRDWDSLLKNPPPERAGSKNDKLIEMQEEILDKLSLSLADMRRLAATCEMLPVSDKNPDLFHWEVLALMVRTFVEKGDRESLVAVLSTRFPEFVGPENPTEYYLFRSHNSALKDPLLVLGEAYSRCKDADVRRELAAAVRRGFVGFKIPGDDDAEFVANAMQWYKQNKSHLSPCEFGDAFFQYDQQRGTLR
jgi:hypothetical protein